MRRSPVLRLVVLACLLSLPAVTGAAATTGTGPTLDAGDGRVSATFRETSVARGHAIAFAGHRAAVVAGTADGDFAVARVVPHVGQGWGGDGRVTTDFGADDDAAYGLAVGADGGVTAVGTSAGNLAVAHYLPAGNLDWSFDLDGKVVRDLGGTNDAGYGVAILGDGSSVVAGGNDQTAVVVKFRPDGALDPAFGAGGVVSSVSPGGPWRAVAVALDGKLLVAGGNGSMHVRKVSATSGVADAAFGANGTVDVARAQGAAAHSIAVQADGRILVAGTSGGDSAVARLVASGGADPTFGTAGLTLLDLGGSDVAYGVAVGSNGAVAAAGDGGDGRGFMAWYRADGSLNSDTVPGGVTRSADSHRARYRGVAIWDNHLQEFLAVGSTQDELVTSYLANVPANVVSFAGTNHVVGDVVVQPDGNVILAGEVSAEIGMVRFLPDGSRDPSFGRGGFVQSDAGGRGADVALQPGGRIVVVALGWTDGTWLVGFRPDGSIDLTFGEGGRVAVPPPAATGRNPLMPNDIAIQPDGKIVLALGSPDHGVLARFTAEGVIDGTFGTGGLVLTPHNNNSSDGFRMALAIQPDGRIVVTGDGWQVRRLLASGAPDVTFGGGGSVHFDPATDFNDVHSVAIAVQPDGRILVGGGRDPRICTRALVIRLLSNGARDTSWRVDPPVPSLGCTRTGLVDLAVTPDGSVLGFSGALVRFGPDGTLDRTVGVDGVVNTGAPDSGARFALAADGNVFTAGGVSASFNLGRVMTGLGWTPRSVVAAPLAGAARITWAAPPGMGLRPIQGYMVRASDGVHTARSRTADTLAAVVTGLKPGVTYTFTVVAVTAHGNSPPSAPSNAMTPSTTAPLRAWGWNGNGQVGDGTTTARPSAARVAGLTGVSQVAGGLLHSVALRADGTVWAWGWNGVGQLGDGTTADRAVPVQVGNLSDVVAIGAGWYHSLAVKADGTVWAWGWNGYGQLGDGTTTDRRSPVRVIGLAGASSVSAGGLHSVAVGPAGRVWGWGWNAFGQLGDGTNVNRLAPVQAIGLASATKVSAGWYHSAAVDSAGVPWLWGWNGYGQVAKGNTDSNRPIARPTGYRMEFVAAGAYHTLVASRDGEISAWGWNGYGQLNGRHPQGWQESWNNLEGGIAGLGAGAYHSAAVLDDGSVWTWGWNGVGQLGDGKTASPLDPVRVPLSGFATAVAGGGLHTLAA